MKSLLRRAFIFLAALVLLFEEWGWEPLAALLARLAKLPLFARIEQRIRALPPYAALACFAAPALMLLPVKLAAVFLIAHGHGMLGLVVLVTAKVAGTAGLAWLFQLTQPTLMQLAWFARWYPRWKAWKDGIMQEVRRSPAWQAARRATDAMRQQWSDFKRSLN